MEGGLGWAIGFVDMPTHKTAPRGVARVHQDQRDARLLRFVGHIGAQLAKRPSTVLPSLRPTNRCCGALTDVRQILHPQCLSICDSFLDGMTIDGIAVTDLLAAYKAVQPRVTKSIRAKKGKVK